MLIRVGAVQRNIDAGSAPCIRIGANEHMLIEHLRAIDHLIGHSAVTAHRLPGES